MSSGRFDWILERDDGVSRSFYFEPWDFLLCGGPECTLFPIFRFIACILLLPKQKFVHRCLLALLFCSFMELARLLIWWLRTTLFQATLSTQYAASFVHLTDALLIFVVPLLVTLAICKLKNSKRANSVFFIFFVLSLASEFDGCILYARHVVAPMLAELTKDTSTPLFSEFLTERSEKQKLDSERWAAGVFSYSLEAKENFMVIRTRPWITLELAEPLTPDSLRIVCEESLDSDYDWEQWYCAFAKEIRAMCRKSLKDEKGTSHFQIQAKVFPNRHVDLRVVSSRIVPPLISADTAVPFPVGLNFKSVKAEFLVTLDRPTIEFPAIKAPKEATRFFVRYEIPKRDVLKERNLEESDINKLVLAVSLLEKMAECSDFSQVQGFERKVEHLYKSVYGKNAPSELLLLNTLLNERSFLIRKNLMRFEDQTFSSMSKRELREWKDIKTDFERGFGEVAIEGNSKALFQLARLVYSDNQVAGKVINQMSADRGYFRAIDSSKRLRFPETIINQAYSWHDDSE